MSRIQPILKLINKLFSHTITSKLIEITYEFILSVNKYQVGDIRNDKTEHTKKQVIVYLIDLVRKL